MCLRNIIIFIFLFTYVPCLGQDSIDIANESNTSMFVDKEFEDRINLLEKKVENFEQIGVIVGFSITIVSTILSLLAFFGFLHKSLDHLITKKLAKNLGVKTEILENALKDFTQEYKVLNETKILIISQEDGQQADLKIKLQAGGFNWNNLVCIGIEKKLKITDEHIILFNRMGNSKLELSAIEKVIETTHKQIGAYFYYGAEQIPAETWNKWKTYNGQIGASNMEDTLISGLVRAIKNYNLV